MGIKIKSKIKSLPLPENSPHRQRMPAKELTGAHPAFALQLDLTQKHYPLLSGHQQSLLISPEDLPWRASRAILWRGSEGLELPRAGRSRKKRVRGWPRVHGADAAIDLRGCGLPVDPATFA